VLLGIGVGAFWTIGGPIGPRLRPEGARATSIIYSGISAGTVAGLPAGALLGSYLGWRSAFIATAVLAAVVIVAMLAFLPSVPAQPGSGIRAVPSVVRTVRIGLIATALGFGGHFAAYTYIAPMLGTAHIDGVALSAVLLVFGIAGFAGNLLAGWASQRAARTAVAATTGLLGLSIVALVLADSNAVVAIAAVTMWGLAFGMLPIAMQTFLFSAAPDRLESAAAAFVSVAQTAIGSGALVGGLLVDHFGLSSALLAGAVCALLSAAAVQLPVLSLSGRKVFS
jgi:predicted MFS family arabinose efflux permease